MTGARSPYEVQLLWGDPGPAFQTFDEALAAYKTTKNAWRVVNNDEVDGATDSTARARTGLTEDQYERWMEA